ncbi:MAG: hypothetical protein ACI4VO_04140 [Clostridia bacterium]
MNREQKLNFIKQNHPKLCSSLEEHVPNLIKDVWNASIEDINLYNAWVAFYCGEINNPDLMDQILI